MSDLWMLLLVATLFACMLALVKLCDWARPR